MNFNGIEAFLAIVETGSISCASEKLFLSQTTVGYRLKSLEDELGFTLVNRKKGQRSIELTQKGNDFIVIANRWMTLWKDTKYLSLASPPQNLTIGCCDVLNTAFFHPLYKEILNEHPNINLSINTFHTSVLYELIESRSIDIAYVFGRKQYKNIISKTVYTEPMYVVSRTDSIYESDSLHPSQLSPENEIYLVWSSDYERWHNSLWAPTQKRYIEVNQGSLMFHYLDNKKSWAIAPLTLINNFKKTNNVKLHKIQDHPLINTCYQLTHQFPQPSHIPAIQTFEKKLRALVDSNNDNLNKQI